MLVDTNTNPGYSCIRDFLWNMLPMITFTDPFLGIISTIIVMKYIFPLLSMFLLFSACQQDAVNENNMAGYDLKTALKGTWQTFQINVAINTADGRDTFRTESLTQEVWEKAFNMESPVYYFQADQKFRRVHRTLNGEIFSQSRGMWNTFGDTLVLIEPDTTYQYLVRIGNGKATFRTFLDWDDDGEADDEYQGLQRQISISTTDE